MNGGNLALFRVTGERGRERERWTDLKEERDRAGHRGGGVGERLFHLITDSVGDDGGNKIENNFKWLLVKMSYLTKKKKKVHNGNS